MGGRLGTKAPGAGGDAVSCSPEKGHPSRSQQAEPGQRRGLRHTCGTKAAVLGVAGDQMVEPPVAGVLPA